MAEEGWGQPQDYVEALSWFTKPPTTATNDAQENIGYMFQHGTGVQIDYRKAMSWFYKAAGQGNSNAENQLGWMYHFGQGMQPDFGKALSWYRLAADQGNKNGIDNLQALTDILQDPGDSAWDFANRSANDAAITQAQRRERIQDLNRRINELDCRRRSTGTTSPTNSNTPARKTTPSAKSSTPSHHQRRSIPASRPKNIAPKPATCATQLAQTEYQSQFSAIVPFP